MCRNLTHLHIEHAHKKNLFIHSDIYGYGERKKKNCKNRITIHGCMKFNSESIC